MKLITLAAVFAVAVALSEDYFYYGCLTGALMNNAAMGLVKGIDPEDYKEVYGTYCRSEGLLLTVFDCIKTSGELATQMGYKHSDRKVRTSYEALRTDCRSYYGAPNTMKFRQIQSAWESAPKPFANYTYANETGVMPFSIPAELIAPQVPGEEFSGDNYYYTDRYSEWSLYYVVICVGLAIVFNSLTWLMPRGAELTANNPVGRLVRRFITMPPMWNDQLARWTHFHSSRLPAFEIFGYFVMNTVMLSVNYHWELGTQYETSAQAVGSMLGYRSGIMIMFKLPYLFFFAGRNNFLISITGWDYTVFSMWHRWIARIATLDVLVHWAAYSVDVSSGSENYLSEEWRMWYWIAGVIATLIMVIMAVQGSVWFRRRAYELFLYTHFFWAIAFLVFTWYHVIWVGYPMETMYASFAVWGYDRIARFVRIALSGVCRANIKVHADDVLVLTIEDKNPVRAFPGSHVFVYFMDPRFFYQSHPFTAVKTESGLLLYVKSWNGVTKTIMKMAVENQGEMEMKVLVEGPYGVPFNLQGFDELVCIAGGIGITSILSHLSTRVTAGNTKQKITLHFIARHDEFFSTFSEHLERFADAGVRIVLHVTGHGSVSETTEHSIESAEDANSCPTESTSDKKELQAISSRDYERQHTRPDIPQLVEQAICEVSGSLAFLTCGPPGLNRDVRGAISAGLNKTKHYVQCYEEGFEM